MDASNLRVTSVFKEEIPSKFLTLKQTRKNKQSTKEKESYMLQRLKLQNNTYI